MPFPSFLNPPIVWAVKSTSALPPCLNTPWWKPLFEAVSNQLVGLPAQTAAENILSLEEQPTAVTFSARRVG